MFRLFSQFFLYLRFCCLIPSFGVGMEQIRPVPSQNAYVGVPSFATCENIIIEWRKRCYLKEVKIGWNKSLRHPLVEEYIHILRPISSGFDPCTPDLVVIHLVPVVVLVSQLSKIMPSIEGPKMVDSAQQSVSDLGFVWLSSETEILIIFHNGINFLTRVIPLLESSQVKDEVFRQSVQESRFGKFCFGLAFLAVQITDGFWTHLLFDQLHEADLGMWGWVRVGRDCFFRSGEIKRKALVSLEFMLDVALVALELPDQFRRKQVDDLAVLYFPHLTDKVFVVFLNSNARIVVEGVDGSFSPPLAVLIVEKF